VTDERNGTETYMTVREIVMEIRADVKDLQRQALELQQARDEVKDHEGRIRSLETWKYGIPLSGIAAIAAAVVAALSHS
jgi:hypothetical protein